MKKAKRLIELVFLLVILTGCLVFHASAAEVVDSGYCGGEGDGTNLTWTLTDDGTLTIEGNGTMADYTEYDNAPWYKKRDFIKAIIIGDHTDNVGEFAFYNCDNLLTVEIGNGVFVIREYAFFGCKNLAKVNWGTNTKIIENHAFYICDNLPCVTFPDNITTIGDSAFLDCTGLDTVTIGRGVTRIGKEAFIYTRVGNVYFEGNAPTVVSADMSWDDHSNSFPPLATLYYIPGTTGWTDSDAYDAEAGTWNGYKLEVWEERVPEIDSPTTVEKTSMVLGNDLSVMFAFTADGITGTGNYAVITKTFADGTADRMTTIAQSDWEKAVINGRSYYTISFDSVAAKEMTDEMQVQIFNAAGEPISTVYTDSLRDYAMRMIENGTSVQMFVDMLVYGAEAQKQFGYSDILATSELTAEQLAQATQSVSYANKLVSDDGYRASSLMLESNIQLVLLFGGIDQTMTAEVSYADHYGNAKNFTIDGSEFEQVIYKGETCHSITIDDLVMADGRQPVTVTVKDADGNQVTSATDSVESYIARMSNTGTLYEAIMKFSDSAAASLKNWQ